MFRKAKLIRLEQTQEGFNAQAESFLSEHGFGVSEESKKLFAAFVQHLPQTEDSFDPVLLAKMMRKARANELAFYLMHPERAPKKEQTDGSETTSETSTEVV